MPTFSEPQACQYFLSLFASANTVPGVTDFRLFFRSQVPRERWAFLLARRAWRESEIDHLYPHAISILTLRLNLLLLAASWNRLLLMRWSHRPSNPLPRSRREESFNASNSPPRPRDFETQEIQGLTCRAIDGKRLSRISPKIH